MFIIFLFLGHSQNVWRIIDFARLGSTEIKYVVRPVIDFDILHLDV